ncbi:XynC protein [Arachidicoccus ginsenosidimutans]|uniref:alpha/beta hydrolase n=1 Tax=Arachidicoccus sp. BS20 TaxID=1850526 RepID=UPI0007F0890F|nr:alpha/beta hydrolase family protein [Arachidicoccus sp. BS20]ANI89652.1 XynC protein [Arachidicoccus sp. BS20]
MKQTKTILLFFFLLIIQYSSKAATVDTVSVYSAAMERNIKSVVILPDSYDRKKPLPVVYLLHGFSGSYADWVTKVPAIKTYADEYNFIIVCPDGGFAGWYFDSPVDKSSQYETFVSKELVQWTDSHFSTINNRKGRVILGLSMGGHGALFLAFKHQDEYGAAGSMSGAVDITGLASSFGISKLLGSYAEFPERWVNHSVIGLIPLLTNDSLKLIIDCGSDDFLYQQNLALHNKLLYDKIDHDFITRPGAHTWEYWANSVQYELLFMHNFFLNK